MDIEVQSRARFSGLLRLTIMVPQGLDRRRLLVATAAIFTEQLMGIADAAASDLAHVSLPEAGFAPDLEARLDKPIADKRIWNIHGVVLLHKGRIVLERYFEGEDATWGRALGRVAFDQTGNGMG